MKAPFKKIVTSNSTYHIDLTKVSYVSLSSNGLSLNFIVDGVQKTIVVYDEDSVMEIDYLHSVYKELLNESS